MIYKIKCEVCLGYSCGGMFNGDDAFLDIDLTDEEAQQIRDNIDSADDTQDIMSQLEENLPDIYEKIADKANEYRYYVVVDDALQSGLWRDCIQSGRDEEDFMQEDIENGDFDPTDEEGNPIEDEDELLNAWWRWEKQNIRKMSYHDRSNYIIDRYECEPDNLEGVTYTIELPSELL